MQETINDDGIGPNPAICARVPQAEQQLATSVTMQTTIITDITQQQDASRQRLQRNAIGASDLYLQASVALGQGRCLTAIRGQVLLETVMTLQFSALFGYPLVIPIAVVAA